MAVQSNPKIDDVPKAFSLLQLTFTRRTNGHCLEKLKSEKLSSPRPRNKSVFLATLSAPVSSLPLRFKNIALII
jgi:hypothetical protein